MDESMKMPLGWPEVITDPSQAKVLEGTFEQKTPQSLEDANGISFAMAIDVPFGMAALRLCLMDTVLFPKFPVNVRTDVAIVEGAGVLSFPVAHATYAGFMSGKYKHMLLVGGHELGDKAEYKKVARELKAEGLPAALEGETEAAYMGRHLKGMGVPSDRFTVLETTAPALDWLGQALFMPALQHAQSVNLVGVFPSRNLMMLRYLRPNLTLTMTNVVPFDEFFSPDDARMSWVKTDASPFVWDQLSKAEEEINQGLYPAVNFHKEIARAMRLPLARPPLAGARMIGAARPAPGEKNA